MASADRIQAPDLPDDLERRPVPDGEVDLAGALVEGGTARVRRLRITDSELRGAVLEAPQAIGLTLIDVVLRDCGLSNADGSDGAIRRVAASHCRLVGLHLGGSDIADLRITDASLELGSFAGARLRDVAFERVVLTEASFQEAHLDHVRFIDCELAGADFRGARCRECLISGVTLNGVMGVEALRGVEMPWSDLIASAGALAAALGIAIADA